LLGRLGSLEESSDLIIETAIEQNAKILADQFRAFPTEYGGAKIARRNNPLLFVDLKDPYIGAEWDGIHPASRAGGFFSGRVRGFSLWANPEPDSGI
jgi:hypothetical protein